MFLVGGLSTAGGTSTVAMNKAPGIENAASGGTLELLYGFWAALLVALVGVIAGFAIAARNRDLDPVLLSIAGANPQQLTAISVLDGTFVMTAGIIIAAGGTGLVGLGTAMVSWPLVHSLSTVFQWHPYMRAVDHRRRLAGDHADGTTRIGALAHSHSARCHGRMIRSEL